MSARITSCFGVPGRVPPGCRTSRERVGHHGGAATSGCRMSHLSAPAARLHARTAISTNPAQGVGVRTGGSPSRSFRPVLQGAWVVSDMISCGGPVWQRGAGPVLLRGATCWDRRFPFGAGFRPATWNSSAGRGRGPSRATIMPSCASRLLPVAVDAVHGRVFLAMGLDRCRIRLQGPAGDPHPYLDHLAGSLGVARVAPAVSRLSCCATTPPRHGAPGFSRMPVDRLAEIAHGRGQPSRTLANLGRFLGKRPDAPVSPRIRR